jgi:DHA1 family multidrug resistance protein-like MFS transporter
MFIDKGFDAYLFGVAFATMSFAVFIASPIWGKIGDSIGYGKVTAVSMPAYGLAQLGFGLTNSAVITIIMRFLGGFFAAGALVCSMAYLVNITTEIDRGKVMSYYVAISSVGSAFGYFIGGIVGSNSLILVFIIQSVGLVSLGLLTYFTLGDTDRVKTEFTFDITLNPFKSFEGIGGEFPKILATFLGAVFLTSFATVAFDNAFNYYLRDALSLSSSYNGIIKAIIGIVTLIVNFTINIYIAKNTEARKSIIYVLILCGISSMIVPFINGLNTFFIANIVFYTFNAIYLPIQQDIVTQGQNVSNSGAISGIFNSVRSAGMIFGSLFSGFIYSVGNYLPFIFASIAFFLSVVISYINYIQYKKDINKEKSYG